MKTWNYHYKSAAQARKENPGTDGGGADGFIYEGHGIGKKIIAFLPHHRDPAEDVEREKIAKLLAAAPELLNKLTELGIALEYTEQSHLCADIETLIQKITQ